MDVRKGVILRKNLDSLAMVFASSVNVGAAAGGNGEKVRIMIVGEPPHGQFERGQFERGQVGMRLRELEPQVAELARANGPVMFSKSMASAPMRTNVAGYVGVTSSGFNITTNINGEVIVGYCDYPMVESVEPGSPAEQGGVLAGDTLIAYNGRDLRDFNVNFSQLLVPGQSVRVRLRRAGRVHEIPITVVPRPDNVPVATANRVICDTDEQRAVCEVRQSGAIYNYFTKRVPPPGVSAGPVATGGAGAMPMGGGRISMRPMPPDFPVILSMAPGAESATLLEAHVSAASEEFAANTGTEAGLLVMSVPAASRAAESGLRAGDVITQVNGMPVRDVFALKRLILSSGSVHSATLQIANSKLGARSLVIRW